MEEKSGAYSLYSQTVATAQSLHLTPKKKKKGNI